MDSFLCCLVCYVFSGLSTGDFIAILSLCLNLGFGIWVVYVLQNNLSNRRVLKDHFISEVKELRKEYISYLNILYLDKAKTKSVLPWFKLMNVKTENLMNILSHKYKTDSDLLNPYQNDLRDLVTDNPDFISQFSSTETVTFSNISKNTFIEFQTTHSHLFNDLIISINDA